MDLINQFIENYKKSLPFMKIWDEFPVHSYRTRYNLPVSIAMVTYRIKNPGRLKAKYCAEMQNAASLIKI